MMTIPPYLKPGDTIGLVCPSGYMPSDKVTTCVAVLEEWGYQVRPGKTVGSQFHYFSGTDEERASDLQAMLDDTTLAAILCARGGYGLSRIIDALDFSAFKKKPKWLIGFSDVTILHAHLNTQLHVATLHAPMAGAFNEGGYGNEYVQSLRNALQGEVANYNCVSHPLNRSGAAAGELVGGNLSLIAHLIGSPSAYRTKGRILFLEDIGEYIYNIDRMMIQLKRSGLLDELAGLIIGGFTEMKDTLIPFGNEVYPLIREHIQPYAYPVCFNFPVSHDTPNYALKVGINHVLHVGESGVRLIQQ